MKKKNINTALNRNNNNLKGNNMRNNNELEKCENLVTIEGKKYLAIEIEDSVEGWILDTYTMIPLEEAKMLRYLFNCLKNQDDIYLKNRWTINSIEGNHVYLNRPNLTSNEKEDATACWDKSQNVYYINLKNAEYINHTGPFNPYDFYRLIECKGNHFYAINDIKNLFG